MTQPLSIIRSSRRPFFGLLMIAALSALLVSCAPAAPAPVQPTAALAQAPAATEAPTQAPAPTEAPTQAPAPIEAPTQAPAPTEAPTQAPAPTEAPTQAPAPTEAPTQAPAPTQPSAQPAAVTFAKDVRPILDQRCLNCHGGKDGVKGGLSMKSYDDLMKGGSEGLVIVPGSPADSLLVELINSGEMPKRSQKLPQNEIDVISAWVAAGAKND